MILCFRCSRETKAKLDSILKSGEYADHAEAISSAVHNLHLMLTEVGQRGTLILDGRGAEESRSSRAAEQQAATSVAGNCSDRLVRKVPALFQLERGMSAPDSLIAIAREPGTPKGSVPLHDWIFGQYNKLLPAKASVRGLAKLVADHPGGLDIDSVGVSIAKEAVALRAYLELLDKKNELSRDAALAVAFPAGGKKAEKSIARFAHHFVGGVSKQGVLSGMLGALRFLAVVDGVSRECQLTEAGWRFAMMENAALDSAQGSSALKFTDAEVEFLLDHISRYVPAEASAQRAIARAIEQGADTPTSMDALLLDSVPAEVKGSVTSAFLSTQRSGVISRMADLGLLKRIRDGTKVRYEMTEHGAEHVSQLAQE